MKKGIKILLLAIGVYLLTFVYFSPIANAIDGAPSYGGHLCSEHDIPGEKKQVCANCHIPHGAKGMKIWGRDWSPNKMNPEAKIKDLCESCHYIGNVEFQKISSGLTYKEHGSMSQWNDTGANATYNNQNGNVFTLTKGETDKSADHVMETNANCTSNSKTAEIPDDLRHLNSDEGGFYCGSCHNPHKQPNGKTDGNGDYLRVMSTVNAGTSHDRRGFCRQCHPKKGTRVHIHNYGTSDPQCEACHRPHDGYKYKRADDIASKQRLILVDYLPATGPFEFPDTSFKASTDVAYKSTNCTSCHFDFTDPDGKATWKDAPKLGKTRGHHPMGRPWEKTSCVLSGCHVNPPFISGKIAFELDGLDATTQNPLLDSDKRKIFDCTSCHAAHTTEVPGNPSFLLYAKFKDDDTAFCEYCHNCSAGSTVELPMHTSKTKAFLAANSGKHYVTRSNSPKKLNRKVYYLEGETAKPKGWNVEGSGGCMLCHFIHLNDQMDNRVIPETNNENSIPTDIKALMRVPAKALDWGNQIEEAYSINLITDARNRYEAMCYGCHADPEIVKTYDETNTGNSSLLNPKVTGKTFYSHRFACKPSSFNTMSNIGLGKSQFPRGDGKAGQLGDVHDDYGTVDGQIYCGTCHDVHDNTKYPYLYRLGVDDFASPYKSDDYKATFTSQAKRDGFCEQCHCTSNNPDPDGETGKITHPVGIKWVPNAAKTLSPFTEKFYGGGSGSDKGITYDKGGSNAGVICLTCHNVHAARTPWSGTAGSTKKVKDLHGYLLVDDNYVGPPGGSMCQGCHDSTKF